MSKHQIKFYPVGNGDSSLITLEDGTTVMIDCHFREGEEDTNGNKIFPVKDDLLSSLNICFNRKIRKTSANIVIIIVDIFFFFVVGSIFNFDSSSVSLSISSSSFASILCSSQ